MRALKQTGMRGKALGSCSGRSTPEAGRDLLRIHCAPAKAAVLSLPEASLHEGKQLWLQVAHQDSAALQCQEPAAALG